MWDEMCVVFCLEMFVLKCLRLTYSIKCICSSIIFPRRSYIYSIKFTFLLHISQCRIFRAMQKFERKTNPTISCLKQKFKEKYRAFGFTCEKYKYDKTWILMESSSWSSNTEILTTAFHKNIMYMKMSHFM